MPKPGDRVRVQTARNIWELPSQAMLAAWSTRIKNNALRQWSRNRLGGATSVENVGTRSHSSQNKTCYCKTNHETTHCWGGGHCPPPLFLLHCKAWKLVGLLYRRYYHLLESQHTNQTICMTLVRPHLEYACQV